MSQMLFVGLDLPAASSRPATTPHARLQREAIEHPRPASPAFGHGRPAATLADPPSLDLSEQVVVAARPGFDGMDVGARIAEEG